MSLQKQIDQMNFWAKMTDKPEMDINSLSDADAQNLYQRIDSGLSPENLHCDGEISRSAAQAKYRSYMCAVKQLDKLGFTARDCYEF